jgi:hypothetical protein
LRLRDRRKTPWTIRISQLFETAFYRLAAHDEGLWDVLLSFEDACRVDPRLVGEPHPDLDGGRYWVYESPA